MFHDYSILNGGFRPFHEGHYKIVETALQNSDYLIIVVGSANRARNTRNPFTTEERIEIIRNRLSDEENERVLITTSNDYRYDDNRWMAGVQQAVDTTIQNHASVAEFTYRGWRDYKHNIALVGMMKDSSSYYLNNFPQWNKSISVEPFGELDNIFSSTGIRNRIFNGSFDYPVPELTKSSWEFIHSVMERNPDEWKRLHSDWNQEQKYESLWGRGPHTTVDAVVVQAGHVLLVTRGGNNPYGEGLLAIPGGFINRDETIKAACIRELREETMLKVPEKVLNGSITERRVFDDPHRSNRSRVITHAFKFELESVGGLPHVKGSDDAKRAKWYPISKINDMSSLFFEDHIDILQETLGI